MLPEKFFNNKFEMDGAVREISISTHLCESVLLYSKAD